MQNQPILNELFDKMRSKQNIDDKQNAIEFFFELS